MTNNMPTPRTRLHRVLGYTLVEIMIVVILIGLLAAIAVPHYRRAQAKAQNTRFTNDLRVACEGIDTYALDRNGYPPDGTPGAFPAELDAYLNLTTWTRPTALGGSWDWDYEQFGYKAGLSVYQPTAPVAQFQALDTQLDDGNLNTGHFRSHPNGYIYIMEF